MIDELEGTIADNFPAGPYLSGDDNDYRYGFQITCKGDGAASPRYTQSPNTDDLSLWTEVVHRGAAGNMVAWMSWLQSNWVDLYDWLDALNPNERGQCKYLCFLQVEAAQALKDAGHLS